MTYDFMRVILFFDLPMVSKTDKRIYAEYRKYLIKNGYMMIQFSVYCKIFNNRDAAVNHINILRKNTPSKGYIRIMLMTEKQYNNSIIIIGGKSNQEKVITVDPMIVL